jgi:uncharacterized protein YbaR (Trm112 family)
LHTCLIQMLECPVCHNELDWTIIECSDTRILTADICCQACRATYAVRDGIGLFLPPNVSRDDLWQRANNQLTQYLRQHPDVERRLMQSPLDTLSPADQFFRTLALEEHGNYAEAKAIEDLSNAGLYTSEYLTCWNNQLNYVIEELALSDGPIVDIASGRCYLVEQLARKLKHPIVASDFSPRVLQQDHGRLEWRGVYERISLLAFDARSTPFKMGIIKTLTTNLGLANVREPGDLLRELRRIGCGRFLAISHFYPENGDANVQKISELGLATLLFRRSALACFANADWEVEVVNSCFGTARPTPIGAVLEGASIDTLPVVKTTLEWCTLMAK